jgi:hypothetical protein
MRRRPTIIQMMIRRMIRINPRTAQPDLPASPAVA